MLAPFPKPSATILKVPVEAGVASVVEILIVTFPGGITLAAVLKDMFVPDGTPAAKRLTGPVQPVRGATDIVKEVVSPCRRMKLSLLTDMTNPDPLRSVKVFVDCVSVLVPSITVCVMVYLPSARFTGVQMSLNKLLLDGGALKGDDFLKTSTLAPSLTTVEIVRFG
jgi:hypothetical protein